MTFKIVSAYWNWTGYSIAVRELGYSMSKFIDVKFISPFPGNAYVPEKIYPLISNSSHLIPEDVVFVRPYFENPFQFGDAKLVANVVLESTKLPERMVKECNDHRIKSIWVPSTFCKKNYIESGVIEEKIHVIPHGFDPLIFRSSTQVDDNKPDDLYTFLFVGGYAGEGDRKGADLLAKAFAEEFRPDDKVKLYLKLNTTYNPNVDLSIFERILRNHDYEIDTHMVLPDAIPNIYAIGDCFVSPTMGEGFGMTILEALVCRLPIITTGYGGQSDFLPKNKRVQIINMGDYIPAKYSQWDCGLWFKPSIAQLKAQMRKAYEEQMSKYKYEGIEKWTWKNAALKAEEVLNEL